MSTSSQKTPDGGVFKTFATAVTEAKNLIKLGMKLEVTANYKRRSKVQCHELAWETYVRHVRIFIACLNAGLNNQ